MDESFVSLLRQPNGQSDAQTADHTIELTDAESGEVSISVGSSDAIPTRYVLKPLGELYGEPVGIPIDPKHDAFLPLFLAIEQEIVREDGTDACGEDSDVLVALDLLAAAPEGDVGHNRLARGVQMAMRVTLSLNDYCRDEVRQALRKIRKSVERHHREGGRRGYLNFIRNYV